MSGYLKNVKKKECFGCEACVQVCRKDAIEMKEDSEGFRYPNVNKEKCISCGACQLVCPYENMPQSFRNNKYVYGGYNLDASIRFDSTSGGAYSAIVDTYCENNYVLFGAEARGLSVFHSYIKDKKQLYKYRKSKYSQSVIGDSYKNVKKFLLEGKKVLFSGTPCQIAGLKNFLKETNTDNLLLIEVICEGVPSPLYVRKYEKSIEKRYGIKIQELDYRYTGRSFFAHGKWDFEIMKTKLMDNKEIQIDRWFNPFWSVWLNHLMSRPSCYECPLTKTERVADITLGDLWGVHLFCPELYGNNGGASLVIANSDKGKEVVLKAQKKMYGHELKYEEVIKYQAPLRKNIEMNIKRELFMADLQSDMSYEDVNKKWTRRPRIKLLFQKYIWGNRQKIFLWKLKNNMWNKRED